jgi:broad specificity phosphatase PhoE/dephospho-CoA kinase
MTHNKLIIILVGLPARGKSFISKKLNRYSTWVGYNSKVFNVGNYRREFFKNTFNDNNFFDSNNSEAKNLRDKFAMDVLEELIKWMNTLTGNVVSIFDATNTTKLRRSMLIERLTKENIDIMFVESICDKKDIIEKNLQMKLTKDDYVQMPASVALDDFKKRILHYKRVYETVGDDEENSYIKIINVQKSFHVFKINSALKLELCNFLMNLNINSGKIYLSRHGESLDNTNKTIGGNSVLSHMGKQYSLKLFTHIHNDDDNDINTIYTSTLKRTIETAKPFSKKYNIINKKLLDEINAGICDGMTYAQIKLIYPDIYKNRKKDKLNYRYPYGESYTDIIERLKYFILDIERTEECTMIITHTAVMRCLLGYFLDIPLKDIAYIDVPLHKIIKLESVANHYEKTEKNLLKN